MSVTSRISGLVADLRRRRKLCQVDAVLAKTVPDLRLLRIDTMLAGMDDAPQLVLDRTGISGAYCGLPR